jgi:transposase-like protein
VSRYIDEHRGRFGVEPICRVLDVSASAYYQRASGQRSNRAVEDERLLGRIGDVHAANYYAYGYRRMWKALQRTGEQVPRCRVQRLMRTHGIVGAKRRGRPWRTTRPDPEAHRRPDLVRRDFNAAGPDELWVADLSYLRCWEGVVFFAFVLDAYSRRVWAGSSPATCAAIARGLSSEDAAVDAGVSPAVGVRWFREGGGMPSVALAPASGRYLSFAEREEVAILRAQGAGVREIARRLGRSPSTISRELRRNAATRGGALGYRAATAQWHADQRARRPKPAKLSPTASGAPVRSSNSQSSSTSATTPGCTSRSATFRRRSWRPSTLPGPRPRSL